MRQKFAFLVLLWLAEVAVIYCSETEKRNNNAQKCGLSDREVDEVFDSVEATWTVDDAFLAAHQLQDVLDCANKSEALVLKVSQRIVLESILVISKPVTIRTYMTTESNAKAILTCPPRGALMLIENATVVLEDIVIQDCFFGEDPAVQGIIRVKCDERRDKLIDLSLLNVEFLNNRNPGGSTGIYVENPDCVSLTMEDVTFSNNTFLRGSKLAHKNNLNMIKVIGNTQISKHNMNDLIESTPKSADIPTSSHQDIDVDGTGLNEAKNALLQDGFIHLPKQSNSTLIGFTAKENDGVVIFVDEGNVDIGEGSIFERNKKHRKSTIVAVASFASFKGVRFEANEYAEEGACLALSDGSKAIVDSTTFLDNNAVQGSCIFAKRIKSLNISRSTFTRNYAIDYATLLINGAFDSSPWLVISETNFTSNTAGSPYSFPFASVFKEGRMDYYALYGTLSISRFDNGRVLVKNSYFVDNHSRDASQSLDGQNFCMRKSQEVDLKVAGVVFGHNTWGNGAALYFNEVSGIFSIEESRFYKNRATRLGSAIYFKRGTTSANVATRVKLVDCFFHENESESATVYFEGKLDEFSMSRVRIDSNLAKETSSAVSVSNVDMIEMKSCTVSGNRVSSQASTAAQGTVYLERMIVARIENSNFSRNSVGVSRGHVGGAVHIYSDRLRMGLFVARRCIFEGNEAADGGAIFTDHNRGQFSVLDSIFTGNKAMGYGGAITLRKSTFRLSLTNTLFTNNTAKVGGAIRATSVDEFTIHGCEFANNEASYAGGAIAYQLTLMDLYEPNIAATAFTNNRAKFGGALLVDRISPKLSHNNGQGSYIDATIKDETQRNNLGLSFTGNKAKIAGGAIFVTDLKLAKGWLGDCSNASDNAVISDESPISKLSTVRCAGMDGNVVDEGGYGPNIATPSAGFFSELSIEKGPKALPQGSTYMIESWKSGDPLPTIQVLTYDMYAQGPARMRSELGSVIWLGDSMVVLPSYNTPLVALFHSPDGLLGTDLSSDMTHGNGTIVVGSPLVEIGDYSLILRVPKVANKSITLNVTARKCLINEFLREDEKECIKCEADHFNFHPMSETCKVCPEKADCSGEYVLPLPGYWNALPCSDHVQECLNNDACLGLKQAVVKKNMLENHTATCDLSEDKIKKYRDDQCEKGYQDVLCGACDENYAKIGLDDCVRCRHWVLIAIAMILSGGFLIYSSWEQITGNLELIKKRMLQRLERPSPGEQESHAQQALNRTQCSEEHAAKAQNAKMKFVLVMQIALNFMQSMAAGVSLDLKWSRQVLELLKAWDWISGTVSQASTFSFECLLPADGKTPRSILSAMLTILVPFLVTGIFCAYWFYDTFKLNKPWRYFIKRCILTCVSVLYVSYLSLADTALNVLFCVDVIGTVSVDGIGVCHSHWVVDTSVCCFDGSHAVLAYSAAIPLLIFVFLYPIVLAVVLILAQRRNALQSEWTRETLGVLTSGFRPTFAFWDCAILARKAMIATVIVFAYKLGSVLQGVLMSWVFVLALYMHLTFLPYRTDVGMLNFLEGVSLFVCGSTVLMGVILTDPHVSSTAAKTSLVSFVFVSNSFVFVLFGYQLLTNKFVEIKYTLLLEGAVSEDDNVFIVFLKYFEESLKNTGKFFRGIATKLCPSVNRHRSDIDGSACSRLLPSSSDT